VGEFERVDGLVLEMKHLIWIFGLEVVGRELLLMEDEEEKAACLCEIEKGRGVGANGSGKWIGEPMPMVVSLANTRDQ